MVYTSRRRKVYDFFKTGNTKYYIAFGFVFVAIITAFILISRSRLNSGNSTTTGNSNEEVTSSIINETEAPDSKGRFKLCLNKATGQITVYAYDKNNELINEPIRYILCSHSDILEGSYTGSESSSKTGWYANSSDKYYRYVSDWGNGIFFRTAEYSTLNERNSLVVSEYQKIGAQPIESGIMLVLSDAKWIYENCSFDSELFVYSDIEEPIADSVIRTMAIPEGLFWDPSENIAGSPWNDTVLKSMSVTSDKIDVSLGISELGILKYVSVFDEEDNDCSSKVFVTGSYDLNKAGEYQITYNAVDLFGNHLTKQVRLTVIDYSIPSETETEETDTEEADTEETETDGEDNTFSESGSDEITTTETIENTSEAETITEPATEPVIEPATEPTTEVVIETTTPSNISETTVEFTDMEEE